MLTIEVLAYCFYIIEILKADNMMGGCQAIQDFRDVETIEPIKAGGAGCILVL